MTGTGNSRSTGFETERKKPGQKITIRYGEVLYPDLPEYKGLVGQMLQANLREASNEDTYYCKGESIEI